MSVGIEQEIEGQRFELALSIMEQQLKQCETGAFAGYLAGMLRLELKRLRVDEIQPAARRNQSNECESAIIDVI